MAPRVKPLKTNSLWVFLLLIGIITLCLLVIRWLHNKAPIRIADVYVINMDKSKDRWEEIQVQARTAKMTLHRWRAVDGTKITEDNVREYSVSKLITRHTTEKKQPGVVGCYLSHKTLLKHLESVSAGSNDAHLIFEDDAAIPADFWEKWNTFAKEVPADWDIIQIGVTYPNLKKVPGCKQVHMHAAQKGNVGLFAYLVKHSSLPKINEHLTYMYDPIDVMLRNKQDEWKIYIAWPQICAHNDHGRSTIVGGKN